MTLQDCYKAMGADYDEVFGRLRSERLIQKFVLRFPDDGSFALLESSLASGDIGEAFRAAHTIKGVCQNLGFTDLGVSSSALTEALRSGTPAPNTNELLEKVRQDYRVTLDAIRAFQASLA